MNLRTSVPLDPADARFVTGTAEEQRRARAEWRRARFIAQVMASNLPEIPRADLTSGRFGRLEDTRTGTFYRAALGQLHDLDYTPAVAYFVGVDGTPFLLERPSGPKTRAELEQQQRERDERRNAPKRRARAKR